MKKIIIRVFVLICALFCAWVLTIVLTPVEPESFAFKTESIVISVGQETSFIDQEVLYPDESWMYIKCACVDETVAKVISTDNIKGMGVGKTTMTCTAGKKNLGSISVEVIK